MKKNCSNLLPTVLVLTFAALAGCATPTAFDKLPESDKVRLANTMAEIEALASCAESAKGNDALFNTKCGKTLSGKRLYAKFQRVTTFGGALKLTATPSPTGNSLIICHVPTNERTLKKLSGLKDMDDVYVTGQLRSYKMFERTRPKTIYESKVERYSHQVELENCSVTI